MKNFFKAAIAAVALIFAPIATQAGEQDFRIINAAKFPIYKLFVSPHGVDSWEEDVLHDKVILPGRSFTLLFSNYERTTMWDIKIQAENGTYWVFSNYNLKTITFFTFGYANGVGYLRYE